MCEIILKPGREKSLIRHHPWIFSGAIHQVKGSPMLGDTVDIISSKGEFLAKASYNMHSNIAARVWAWEQAVLVNPDFFESKIKSAIETRQKLTLLRNTNALRLVHAESDGIPGLILDQYDDICVVQFLTAGVELWKHEIVDIIRRLTHVRTVYERSDVDVRQLEGLPLRTGLLVGDKIEKPVEIYENNIRFIIDLVNGHKTGFYLDQRENRFIARLISADKKVLDCFSYTGGFSVNCAMGNARSICLLDSSERALNFAKMNISINQIEESKFTFVEQDVFQYLRSLRDQCENFDLIILDPPKFAPTSAQAERAARGYKDINLLAFKLLNKDGYLLTFSCSGGISAEFFQKIIAGAALDAGSNAIIINRLNQAADHPVALNFPEGAYLKGLLIQKIN